MKHGGSIMLGDCFTSTGTGKVVGGEEEIEGGKHRM